MSDDPAEQTPAPIKMLIEAIIADQDLVHQLEPMNEHEAEVRDRTATLLSGLLDRMVARREERPPASAVALTLNLEVHPHSAQAVHDLLVVPLLAITAVQSSRGLQAWESEWLDKANNAVWRDLQAHRASGTAEGTW